MRIVRVEFAVVASLALVCACSVGDSDTGTQRIPGSGGDVAPAGDGGAAMGGTGGSSVATTGMADGAGGVVDGGAGMIGVDGGDDGDVDCVDNADFVSEQDEVCSDWDGYDCTRATEDWAYSAQGELDVIANCALSCDLCALP